jgi:hypothetical protein
MGGRALARAARRGKHIAAVATARKLAMIIWHMLTKGADYIWARPVLLARKFRAAELRAGSPIRPSRWIPISRDGCPMLCSGSVSAVRVACLRGRRLWPPVLRHSVSRTWSRDGYIVRGPSVSEMKRD